MVKSAKPPESNAKTALRVIEIIETFAKEQRPLSMTQIARELSAPVSSCQTLLKTLINLGYIYETGAGHVYYPTGRLQTMVDLISRCDPVLENILGNLRELNHSTNETILLAKLNPDRQLVILHIIESTSPIRYSTQPGTQIQPHANSAGHALLSTLDAGERRRLLTGRALIRYNKHTMTNPAEIEHCIQQSLIRGWFSGANDSGQGIGTISWPVRIAETDYSLTVGGPLDRIIENEANYAQELRFACANIEQSFK